MNSSGEGVGAVVESVQHSGESSYSYSYSVSCTYVLCLLLFPVVVETWVGLGDVAPDSCCS